MPHRQYLWPRPTHRSQETPNALNRRDSDRVPTLQTLETFVLDNFQTSSRGFRPQPSSPNISPRDISSFTQTAEEPRHVQRPDTRPHLLQPHLHTTGPTLDFNHQQIYGEATQHSPRRLRLRRPVRFTDEFETRQRYSFSEFLRSQLPLQPPERAAQSTEASLAQNISRGNSTSLRQTRTPSPPPTWFEGMCIEKQCPVCYEQIAGIRFLCRHALCVVCYDKMFLIDLEMNVESKCPMCRAVIHGWQAL